MNNIRTFALFLCFLSAASVKAQEIVFEKRLPNQGKFVVQRKEVPYVPPTEEQKAQLAKDIPGAQFFEVKPWRVSEYSLLFFPTTGANTSLSWKKTAVEFMPDDFRIYDVQGDNKNYVILAKEFGYMRAEVITPDTPKKRNEMDEKWGLLRESDAFGPLIKSGIIEGSLKANDLSVVLKGAPAYSCRFFWRDGKWQPQKTESARFLFEKPLKIKEQSWRLALHLTPNNQHASENAPPQNRTATGTRLELTKTPIKENGEADNDKKVLLWQSLDINNPSAAPNFWSADAVVDEKTQKLYAVLANGSRFWLQVVDFSRREAPTREGDTVLLPHVEPYSIETPPDVTAKLPYIEAVQIEKVGEELQVSINKGETPKWAYSFATRRWKEVPPETPKAN